MQEEIHTPPETDLAEAAALIAGVPHWHHTFELVPGLVTPGNYAPQFMWEKLQLPPDLRACARWISGRPTASSR